MGEVGSDHPFTGETLLKYFPHATALNKTEILNRVYSFNNLVFDDEARDTVHDDLGSQKARGSEKKRPQDTCPEAASVGKAVHRHGSRQLRLKLLPIR